MSDRPSPVAIEELRRRREAEVARSYRVIAISMYQVDLARLDELVCELKAKGATRANRSAVIRIALEQLDLDETASRLRASGPQPITKAR